MKRIVLLLLSPVILLGQNPLIDGFKPLMNKTWKASGTWGNNTSFKQEVQFKFGLDSMIVIAESLGYTNEAQSEYGPRNHGVRQYDQSSNSVKFWEFDVFGGLTTGDVLFDKRDIYYSYQYGDTQVTDYWGYMNDSSYNYTVGIYQDSQWVQKFLETEFVSIKYDKTTAFNLMKNRLKGSWTSKAWEGEIIEIWETTAEGDLYQTAEYIEDNKVLYESTNLIKIIANELILTTIIKGNNPKIFKAIELNGDYILFENTDYDNPSRVKYELSSRGNYKRTITGKESGQMSQYTFNFQPIKKALHREP